VRDWRALPSVRCLDSAKGKPVNIPVLDPVLWSDLLTLWDLFAATQKNFKPEEKSGGRDLCSV